jgi:CO/xanthine dehydrogenase FAD-binding subunit
MQYFRPTSLNEALELKAKASAGLRILAGGTDLYPATEARELGGDILDLTALPELSGIRKTAQGWRIGAMTRWSEVARADLPTAFDALQQAAREIGAVQIQTSGTLGGNLCNASPAADGVPPLLVLDAEVEIASTTGIRRQPLASFITGARRTTLAQGEILTAVFIPSAATSGISAFGKLGARKYMVISIVMVAVRLELDGERISNAAIAVGAASPVAKRLPGLEAALVSQQPDDPESWRGILEHEINTRLSPIDDIRASAEYRRCAVIALIEKAIGKAAGL